MKSKTSFYNKTLFLNTIKRFWPLFAAYLFIWLIIMPLFLNGSLSWASKELGNNLLLTAEENVLLSSTNYATYMSSVFGLFFAMAAFSYLYNQRSVSMICALPHKREGVFISFFSTGIFVMLISNIIVFLICIPVESAYGALEMSYLWQWLGMVSLKCVFFYGFAVFCASLTGNILVLPFLYLVLNFTVVVVEKIIRAILISVNYGMSNSTSPVLGFMSPIYELLAKSKMSEIGEYAADGSYTLFGYEFNHWPTLIIYGAVGIAFAVLALLFIKNRRMETAGDVVAIKPLKPIFKYCMAFGCSLVLGVVINETVFYNSNHFYGYGNITILLFCMVLGAFIGYFSAEMLMQKTLRVFAGRAWVGLGISCFVIIALMLSCEFDVFGFERRVPAADEVESVSIKGSFDGSITLEDPENIQEVIDLHKSVIDNKKIYENYSKEKISDERSYLCVDYYLKNGKDLLRNYVLYFNITDDCDALNDIINCREAVNYRKQLSIPASEEHFSAGYISYLDMVTGKYQSYELSKKEAIELYKNCIVPDIDSGAMGNIWLSSKYSKVNGKSYFSTVYDCDIYIEFRRGTGETKYAYDSVDTYLTVDAKNTLAWIKEHGIEPAMMGASVSPNSINTELPSVKG